MKTKYTSEPWEAKYEHGIGTKSFKIVASDNTVNICTGPIWTPEHSFEMLANSTLISAAPEMLKALMAIRDIGTFSGTHTKYKIEKAIAKAIGETYYGQE